VIDEREPTNADRNRFGGRSALAAGVLRLQEIRQRGDGLSGLLQIDQLSGHIAVRGDGVHGKA
jgi:hypothetical protein